MTRVNITLDTETIARLKRIQAAKPELESLSATIRHLARQADKELNREAKTSR